MYQVKPQTPVIDWGNSLTNGLVLCLPFSEKGNASKTRDLVYNLSTDLTSPTWVQGVFGPTITFNGSTTFGSVTDNSKINPTSLSIAMWFRTNGTTGEQELIDKRIFSGGNGGYNLRIGGTFPMNVKWVVRNSGAENSVSSTGVINDLTWTFVVATFNAGTTTAEVFLNGTSYGTVSTSMSTSTNDFVIGALRDKTAFFFKGDIANVYMWNRALGKSEVKALYEDPWRIYKKPSLWTRALNSTAAATVVKQLSALGVG